MSRDKEDLLVKKLKRSIVAVEEAVVACRKADLALLNKLDDLDKSRSVNVPASTHAPLPDFNAFVQERMSQQEKFKGYPAARNRLKMESLQEDSETLSRDKENNGDISASRGPGKKN